MADKSDQPVYARADRSIICILRRLLETFVCVHLVFDCCEQIFQCCSFLPVFEQRKVVHSTISLVYARKIAFIIELQNWRSLRVAWAALDVQTVNPVFEVGLSWIICTLQGPRMVPFQKVRLISSAACANRYIERDHS